MNIVRVALDVPLPRLFDYLAPDSDESDIGRRVDVPFGKGSKTGIIVGLSTDSEQPENKLKPVAAILRDMPALPPDWLALCEFCARYYQTPLGEVTSFALPPDAAPREAAAHAQGDPDRRVASADFYGYRSRAQAPKTSAWNLPRCRLCCRRNSRPWRRLPRRASSRPSCCTA
jgi:primosomal protein N'